MTRVLRESTLQTLGLGTVIDIFKRGALPASASDLVDQVFGGGHDRGSLLISGASGIVGAGKTVQLGSRLESYGVPIVALDFPGAPDGIGRQYPGLVSAFGQEQAARILSGVVRFTYDGVHLPPRLAAFKPRFALEAVPEVLAIKKAHYQILRAAYDGIEIRSVTSGFPSSQLGVGVAHPAFPHNINKVWEVVEEDGTTSSAITQLFWALGLMPMPVADRWSFVLDVLFCGLTQAATRYHEASGMPFWKVDKQVRKLLGPNPFRAHDAIGTKGATFLTLSCLKHLGEHYGALFTPSPIIAERAETGTSWYPPNHFRPLVQWTLDGDEEDELRTRILGPLFQMTALMLHEERAHFSYMNSIGELCAQLAPGVLARLRATGTGAAIRTVEAYHRLEPQAAGAWHPDALDLLDTPEGRQLYVNAEHDGTVGVITLGRESYSWDVDAELGRAIDWLRGEGIERVILSGDFHIARQLVGADTRDFFPGLDDAEAATALSAAWSRTARRLSEDFAVSVAFLSGKRCLGGMLELALHCDYVVAEGGTRLGFPEVTLPVVPGMEGCHLPFRRTDADAWPQLLSLLLEGRPVKAAGAVGWLIDHAGPLEDALAATWAIASGGDHAIAKRPLETGPLAAVTDRLPALSPAGSPATDAARKAIVDTVRDACSRPMAEALDIQARHSGDFIAGEHCRRGAVGTAFAKTMKV